MKKAIALPKGESIKFLDYTIKNSKNNDGLVLMREKNGKGNRVGVMDYESHLGNYGEGTQENIDTCKKYAILHFMARRPEVFASSVVNKMRRINSGTMHEFFLLKECCKNEGIEMPEEIGCGDGINCMIYFNGEPLAEEKESEDDIEFEIEKEVCHHFYYLGAADGIIKSISRDSNGKPDFEKRYKEFKKNNSHKH